MVACPTHTSLLDVLQHINPESSNKVGALAEGRHDILDVDAQLSAEVAELDGQRARRRAVKLLLDLW
jgi:hypothetical protein